MAVKINELQDFHGCEN